MIEIDLVNERISRSNNSSIYFEIDSYRKECLIEGLDDIAITLKKIDKIKNFEQSKKIVSPWL